jgi:hypothetical protein
MPFAHDAIAALGGLTGNADADKALLRSLVIKRIAYPLTSAEDGSDFTAVDPFTGSLPLYLIKDGTLYQLDAFDNTTPPGATCIVTNDSKRYKSGGIDYPWSVISRLNVQPEEPSVGDRHLITAAATGDDWAGQDNKVGIYTAGGWRFAVVPIGRPLYVEAETAFYHRNAAGAWTAGFGSILLPANSVNLTHILGANASYVVKVENQTTNAPPSSSVAPVAYIIGSSPTGAWSGHAGKLAICLVDGTFTIRTPVVGDVVYDKSQSNSYEFNGTAWVSQRGAWRFYDVTGKTVSGSTSDISGSVYSFAGATPPTQSQLHVRDNVGITRAAARLGANQEFKYTCTAVGSSINCLALFRDNESNAIDHAFVVGSTSAQRFEAVFAAVAPDTLSHTYRVGIMCGSFITLQNRRLSYQEGY